MHFLESWFKCVCWFKFHLSLILSHYLNQCWPRWVTSYVIYELQGVKIKISWLSFLTINHSESLFIQVMAIYPFHSNPLPEPKISIAKNMFEFPTISQNWDDTGSSWRKTSSPASHSQYHGCWWPGDTWSQGIRGHGIYLPSSPEIFWLQSKLTKSC